MSAPMAHALLGASSAYRWMACPGSALLAAEFPDTGSIYAEEGSLAHDLAEKLILHKPTSAIKRKIKKFYADHPELDGSVEEMTKVLQPYVDFVREEYNAVKAQDEGAELLTEQKIDTSRWIPGGFGTTDVAIVGANRLHIIDLKYGKGVPVSAENNPQIRIYALGTMDLLDTVYEFGTVQTTIYQPRLDNVSTEAYYVEDLEEWGEIVLAPAAQAALQDDAPMHAGEWCRFCPAKATCWERTRHNLVTAEAKDKLLTMEQIGQLLCRLDDLVKWAKDVQEHALASALKGEAVPGWKVVEGRSVRKYTGTEAEIVKQAEGAGFDRALLYETKLLGVSAMEKLMGKKKFADVLGAYIEKPPGKPTLVEEEDPRPAINNTENAVNDFFNE